MNWRCQDTTLVGVSGRRARVTALRCRRWSCEWCAKRLRAKMVAHAHAGFIRGQRVRMFTLTAPGNEGVEQSYDQLARRWKRFRESLRRRFPGARFEYFRVTERQGRGHAHLHVLSRGPFIPQRWLSEAAGHAGLVRSPTSARLVPAPPATWPSTWARRWAHCRSGSASRPSRAGIAVRPGPAPGRQLSNKPGTRG